MGEKGEIKETPPCMQKNLYAWRCFRLCLEGQVFTGELTTVELLVVISESSSNEHTLKVVAKLSGSEYAG